MKCKSLFSLLVISRFSTPLSSVSSVVVVVSLLHSGRDGEYCDQPVCLSACVCVSASISLEPLDRSAPNFVCRSSVAVARSSPGGVSLHYVLPVL